MKKTRTSTPIVAMIALAILTIVGTVIAGQVYGRTSTALAAATGNGTWTNTHQYGGVELKRIWIANSLIAANTVTVQRVATIGSTTFTQTVGSVGFASGNGSSTATLTASYLAYGDQLRFTSADPTGSVAIVEYEFQQH